jgi:sterol desaturase/sphingolipid hydroxylase (fatty acid hydroxylase superfamily)
MLVLSLVEAGVPLRTRPPFDARRTSTNIALTILLFSTNAVLGLLVLPAYVGLLPRLGLPPLAALVIGVVALDFCTYAAHVAMHRVPLLWRFHRVHHRDAFIDVTTSFRFHPGEGIFRWLMTIVPAIALGVGPEALLVYRMLSAINGLLEHANVRVPTRVDAILSYVWVTPNMHKVHHSRERAETDTNFGNLLSVYDRVLRTFTPSARAPSVTYGL